MTTQTKSALAAIAIIAATAVSAHAADCKVSAYDAYIAATERPVIPDSARWEYRCRTNVSSDTATARFRADRKDGMICEGTVLKTPDPALIISARFFITPATSTTPGNGWHITSYAVDGPAMRKTHHRDTLVAFKANGPANPGPFSYALCSITFSKEGGNCDAVLREALGGE